MVHSGEIYSSKRHIFDGQVYPYILLFFFFNEFLAVFGMYSHIA